MRLRSSLLLCTLALALVAGCGGPKPRDWSVLRVAQTAEPTTLDPAQVQDGPTIELMMHVYDGLVQWNTENQLIPALAESWDVSNGGKTYTFHLRKGVKFHNGRPLVAQDFVFSITRSLDPRMASPVAMTYLNDLVGAEDFNNGKTTELKSVEAPDDATLRLTIDQPKAYFLSKLTYPTAYAVCREAVEKTGGKVSDESMIGTGAFRLAEYRNGDRLILDANPDYFEGAPKLRQIVRRIVLENNTRYDMFEGGQLDITDISMAQYRAVKDDPNLGPLVHQFDRPSIYYMSLNQKAYPPFKDKRVRQAFAMAVNRSEILSTVMEGLPKAAQGILPPGVPGYDENGKGLPYNPEKAKQLLAEAGYPGGSGLPPLAISFRANMEDIRNVAVALSSDLQKNLGVACKTDETEWTTFLKKRNEGVLPLSFLRWAADYLDPQNFLSILLRTGSGENHIAYSNREFDRLCDAADTMQDPKERLATYRKAERIAVDDAPWVPMYFQRDVELWSPALRGVEDMAMGHLPHKRAYFAPPKD